MSVILQAKNLDKTFISKGKSVHAVKNLSVAIERGKIYGLVGESGSGKTTLGKMLLGLLRPDTGRVLFNDEDISRFSRRQKKAFCRNAQIIFQNPYEALDPAMRIGDIIEEPLLIHKIGRTKKEREKIVDEMRMHTGLDTSVMSRRPDELSGGQRQRAAIAAAMILKPQLVVCDECVSSLDVLVQAQILNLLKDFQKNLGITCVFISHNLSVISYMADTIGVMHEGTIVEEGPTGEVLSNPKNEYTKKLLDSRI